MAMEKFRASPLPIPSVNYDPQYVMQLVRVIELYFKQLDSQTPLQAEYFKGLGYQLTNPHIAASDSTDQIATGNNIATGVKWNTLDSGFGWTLNAPGSATADYAGVYTIRYSLQFVNSANAVHFASVWVKVNGVDVANSTTKFSIPARKSSSPGEEGFLCVYSEATFAVNVGDTFELYWATDLAGNPTTPTDGVYMFHDAAQVTPFARPAIPSAIGSITFVSALPPS
jgi:hypothetical protein